MQVWKYTFGPGSNVKGMPDQARVLHVAMQGSNLCGWFEVDPDNACVTRMFEVVGTGQDIPDLSHHCGTALAPPLVWHLYEVQRA